MKNPHLFPVLLLLALVLAGSLLDRSVDDSIFPHGRVSSPLECSDISHHSENHATWSPVDEGYAAGKWLGVPNSGKDQNLIGFCPDFFEDALHTSVWHPPENALIFDRPVSAFTA